MLRTANTSPLILFWNIPSQIQILTGAWRELWLLLLKPAKWQCVIPHHDYQTIFPPASLGVWCMCRIFGIEIVSTYWDWEVDQSLSTRGFVPMNNWILDAMFNIWFHCLCLMVMSNRFTHFRNLFSVSLMAWRWWLLVRWHSNPEAFGWQGGCRS